MRYHVSAISHFRQCQVAGTDLVNLRLQAMAGKRRTIALLNCVDCPEDVILTPLDKKWSDAFLLESLYALPAMYKPCCELEEDAPKCPDIDDSRDLAASKDTLRWRV